MKLCRECKWLKGENCINPKNTSGDFPDYINGFSERTNPIYYGAQKLREKAEHYFKPVCGPNALWFEPKEEAK